MSHVVSVLFLRIFIKIWLAVRSNAAQINGDTDSMIWN